MAGCGHGHCEHDHNHISEEKGFEYSLYTKIDFTHLEVLNEAEEGSGKAVFKPWEERLDSNKVVLSSHWFVMTFCIYKPAQCTLQSHMFFLNLKFKQYEI